MSKTYSFPKVNNPPAEMPWQARWTKKFGEWQKPIVVPAELLEKQAEGIGTPPPVPSDPWGVSPNYAAMESKIMIDWAKALDCITGYSAQVKKVQDKLLAEISAETVPLGPTKPPEPRVRTNYLKRVYEPEEFKLMVEEMAARIRPYLADFDAIAFRGSSGAAIAYPLSFLLGKPLMHVRKPDNSHSELTVEGFCGARNYIIVDDFVCSGSTLREIVIQVDAYTTGAGHPVPKPIHLFLYSADIGCSDWGIRENLPPSCKNMQIHLAHGRDRT